MILSAKQLLFLIERENAKAKGEIAEPVPPIIFDYLRKDLIEFALDAEEGNTAGLTACGNEAPGYLNLTVQNVRIYAPWHLVEAFPDIDTLMDLLKTGRRLSLSGDRGLCISGSATLAGLPIEIGDIDFAQYTAEGGQEVGHRLEILKTPSAEKILIGASYGSDCRSRLPWANWEEVVSRVKDCRGPLESKRIMLDYLVRTEGFGLLPASAAILMSDFENRSSSPAKESFVFQEIVVVPVEDLDPPWSLVDPEQIGAYLLFLFGQIKRFKIEKPMKAVKRALSLSYILSLNETIDRAIDLLTSERAKAAVRLKRQSEVAEIVELLRSNGVIGWECREIGRLETGEFHVPESVMSDFESLFEVLAHDLHAEGEQWPTF